MSVVSDKVLELVRESSKLTNLDNFELMNRINSVDLGDLRLNDLVLNYFFSSSYLDGDLLNGIEAHRGGEQKKGSLVVDLNEVNLLMHAFKSPQYRRFMYHIMNAYGNNEIYPISDDHVFDCCICWKKTFGSTMHERWFSNEPDTNKEYLAFTAKGGTKTSICLDCLVQLKYFIELIKEFDEASGSSR